MTLEELLKELRWIPSGGGCMDASCEGCEWEEKERARIESEITKIVEKAREEGRKEGYIQGWNEHTTEVDTEVVLTQYKEELLNKINKLYQDERPVDCIDGETPVETYGYEETHNNALSEVKKLL